MFILTIFYADGIGKENLTPLIDIYNIADNTKVISDAEMSPVGQGIYKYWFAGYDSKKEYVFLCKSNSDDTDNKISLGVSDNLKSFVDMLAAEFNSGNIKIKTEMVDMRREYRIENKIAGNDDLISHMYQVNKLPLKTIASRLKLDINTVKTRLQAMGIL